MSEQLDFFRREPATRHVDFARQARRSDPATSHVAAARAEPIARRHHAAILAALSKTPAGATIHEMKILTGIDHVAVARRMSELEREGLVRRTGGERPSPAGRPCCVWEVV